MRVRLLPGKPPHFPCQNSRICEYLEREKDCPCASVRERFLYMRDRALLALQFFAGDRASDVCTTKGQDVRQLPGKGGLVIRHTQGKTASSGQPRIFVLHRSSTTSVCPVAYLDEYIRGAQQLGVDLTVGYLFRRVTEVGEIIQLPVT